LFPRWQFHLGKTRQSSMPAYNTNWYWPLTRRNHLSLCQPYLSGPLVVNVIFAFLLWSQPENFQGNLVLLANLKAVEQSAVEGWLRHKWKVCQDRNQCQDLFIVQSEHFVQLTWFPIELGLELGLGKGPNLCHCRVNLKWSHLPWPPLCGGSPWLPPRGADCFEPDLAIQSVRN